MIRRPGRDEAQDFHDAWESRRPATGEVAELVRTAEALCVAAAEQQPSTDFRAALRERLMTEAATVLVAEPGAARTAAPTPVPARPSRARRRVAGLVAAAVSSVGVVGLVAGSAQAVPGDVLYPVKRGVENVELALHRGEQSQGAYRLELAAERLREVRTLVDQGSPTERAQLPTLLDEFSEQAERGSAQLFDVYGAEGGSAAIERVNDFAASAAVGLSTLSTDVPEDARQAFASAATVVTDLVGQASTLCADCSSADVGDLADVVSRLAAAAPTSQDATRRASADAETSEPAAGGSRTTSPTSSAPRATLPAAPKPTPKSTTKTLRDVTDPVVGGLLGDETQEGLVPGLVNGLLGTEKK